MGDTAATDGVQSTGTSSKIVKGVKSVKDKVMKGWGQYPEESGKAGQVLYGCGDGVPADASYFHRLQSDLANSYYWTGGFWKDYFFFVANWHPLLGILLCHPNHPWTKLSRTGMLLISLSLTLVPSAAIGTYLPPPKGREWVNLRTPIIIACVTIPDIIIGVVLYQLSIAGSRCPNLCGCCLNFLKKCAFVYVILITLGSAGCSYFILESADANWRDLLVPLVEGRVWSFLTWFPVWLVLPCQLGFIDLWCFERWMARRAAAQSEKQSGMELGEAGAQS